MFESLADRLQGVFRNLTGQGRLTPDNIRESLRDVRRALLEADVPVQVAKDFVARIEERAVGEEVLKSLTPGQQVVGVVREELVKLLGESRITLAGSPHLPDHGQTGSAELVCVPLLKAVSHSERSAAPRAPLPS